MYPRQRNRNKKIVALLAVIAVSAVALSVGDTQGRRIEWASAELVYTPQQPAVYESNCLTREGQDILLSDWTADQEQKNIVISVTRPPEPEEETTGAPEEGETTQENSGESTEETQEPSWPQEELTVTLDELALQHIGYESLVEEDQLVITLTRLPEAPGLTETTVLTVLLQWQGLTGTLRLNMLPYGEQAGEEAEETPSEPERQTDTTLEPVQISDTIHSARPAVCVKLNLETGSDFTIFFNVKSDTGTTPLKMVRWSMDGGQSYSLLYDAAQLEIAYPYPENWDGVVMLDMTQALEPDVRPTVAVEATGYSRRECTPVIQALPTPASPILATADLPQVMKIATRWGAATMNIESIQRLTVDEAGNLTYTEDNAFRATVINGGIRMESAREDLLPPSGSYRLQIKWLWNGICVEEQTVYFFVNTN